MSASIIFPSVLGLASINNNIGVQQAGYPLTNMLDLARPSKITRWTTNAAMNFWIDFSAPVLIDAIAIVGHNAAQGTTIEVSAHAGVGVTGAFLYGSGVVGFYPAIVKNTRYRAIRPLLMPAPVVARSVFIRFSSNDVPWEVEALEFGKVWKLPGIGMNRKMGFEPDASRNAVAGGADFARDGAIPARTYNAKVDYMKMAEAGSKGLDFQKHNDLRRPFVFGEDIEDPATWVRRLMLMRNQALPPSVGALYRHDAFPLTFIEHIR